MVYLKERLYEDTLHLKNNVHVLVEENLKLKTRIRHLEVTFFFWGFRWDYLLQKEYTKLLQQIEEMNNQENAELCPTRPKEVLIDLLSDHIDWFLVWIGCVAQETGERIKRRSCFEKWGDRES